MKNVNIKKVVAGAAALAIAAGSLGAVVSAANVADSSYTTPNGLARADMFNAQGAPSYNIVVGSTGHASDVVWAANIAAAIGKKAYNVSTASATGGDVVVEVGAEGITSVSGDGYLSDGYTINDVVSLKTLDETDYSVMYKKDISADSTYAGASTLTVYDELSVTANVWFNTDKDVKDLVASIDKGAIKYTVDFDEGIKNTYKDSLASPRLSFNLMGKNYTVEEYDGTTLKLVQNLATETFAIGATFNVEDYTVEVVDILDTGATTNRYEVEMQLKDASGTLKATDVFRSGDTKIFDSYLTANIDVDTVYASSIKVIMGSSGKLELKNGSKIDDFPNKDDKLWKCDFVGSTTLTSIILSTDDSSLRFTNDDSLLVGDSIELPLEFGSIDFLGLTNEKSSEFEIKDNYIYFTDQDRKSHEVFMFDLDEATTARDSYTSVDLDGKPLYVKFYDSTGADANFTVQLDDSDGKYLVGGMTATPTWGTTQTHYTTKTSHINGTNANVGVTYDLRIPLYNNTDRDLEYTLAIEPNAVGDFNSVKSVAMGLTETQTAALQIGDTIYSWDITSVDVDGTDTGAFGNVANFIGGRALNAATFNASVARDEFQSIARIDVYNTTDTHIYSYIDAYTGDLVNLNDNDFKDAYKQVEYTDGSNTFELDDKGDTTSLEFGYTTYGAYVSIEDGYPMFTLPEKQLKGQIFIGGGSSSETTLNGGEVTLTTPGEVVETEDGKISVKLVSAPQGSATTYTPAAFGNIAYLDTDTLPAGNKIIVGGWMVNEEAKTLGLEDLVTKAGDFVAGKNAQGNIVVAGFHKEDTANAAKELISAIEAMN